MRKRLFQTVSVQVQKAMAVMPTQLDYIREDPKSDSSGSELSSHTGSDTDYKPIQTTSSSSAEEDLKSRDKASSCELKGPDSEDEGQQRDGEADHLSPQKTLEHCGGDGTSDMDDQSPGPNLAKRLPQKKSGKKKAVVKKREGPKVQLKRPWSEAERTAADVLLLMSG